MAFLLDKYYERREAFRSQVAENSFMSAKHTIIYYCFWIK